MSTGGDRHHQHRRYRRGEEVCPRTHRVGARTGRPRTHPVRVPPLRPDVARLASLPRVFSSPRPLTSPLHPPRHPRSSKELRQLYRDLIPNTLEKCITYDDLNDWPDRIQRDILHASARLAELVARKLAPAALARTDDEDAEEDILCLLQALAWTLDADAAFHRKHELDTPPRFVLDRAGVAAGSNDVACKTYSAPSFASSTRRRRRSSGRTDDDGDRDDGVICIEADSDEDESARGKSARKRERDDLDFPNLSPAPSERRRWLRYLVDCFGDAGGFDAMLVLMRNPGVVSLRLLEVAIRPVARCAGCLEETFLGSLEEAAGTTLAYLEALAEDGGDRLVGGGGDARDRNYAHVCGALRGARELLVACVGAGEAERRVSDAHRAVVKGMLGVSTFNSQLAALREINAMLDGTRGETSGLDAADAAAAVRVAVEWLEAERVLPHVLRPVYLHHKQYVDQVSAILRRLLQEGAARAEYLDILWDVTRKPDTFEEVKHNVYDLLAALAWHFSEEQLDDLFRRVERAGKIALSDDAGKILEMVQKLARSDARGIMAERLLELLWRMTHSGEGGAASDEETVAAFANILGHYERTGAACASRDAWARRALSGVGAGDEMLAVSLRLFRSIASSDPGACVANLDGEGERAERGRVVRKKRKGDAIAVEAAGSAARRREWIRRLDRDVNLLDHLLAALERFQTEAWGRGDAATSAPASEGYAATLDAFMDTTLFAVTRGELAPAPDACRRLWRAFVERPPRDSGPSGGGTHPSGETYRDRGLMWMTKLLTTPPCVLSEACVADLLASRLVEEPADAVTARGWCLFESFFLQAGLDAGRLVPREEARHLAAEDDEVEIISPPSTAVAADDDDARVPDPVPDPGPARPPRRFATDARARGDRSGLCTRGREPLAGAEQLWRIALDAPPTANAAEGVPVAVDAIGLLIQTLVVNLERGPAFSHCPAGDAAWRAHVADARDAFFARVLTHLRDAASALRAAEDDVEDADRAERRASRCLLAMSRAVRAAERHHPPPANAPAPHGASFAGSSVTLEVHPVAHRGARMGAVVVRTNLNATVRGVKRLVARKLDASAKHLRLIVGGRDLGASEGDVLGACLVRQEGAGETIRAQALVNRVGEDEDAVEGVDADSDEAALARLPRVQLARQPGAHDVLLELAEVGGKETRALAREMLRTLPTRLEVREQLRDILAREDPADASSRFRELLSRSPERTVYALQALDGLLSPNDADEEAEANSRALRGSFAASGCAREVLAVLPRGGAGSQGGSVEAASPASSAGASAWRDPESRRALCGASLSLLRISLDPPSDADVRERSVGSLGIGAVAVSSPAADRGSDPDAALEDVVETTAASRARVALAADAAPALAELAHAVGSGAGASPGRDEDDNDAREANARAESVTREDVRLASAALRLLFRCVRSTAEPPETAADILPRSPLFPSMVRDLMIQSPFPALRRAFAAEIIRAATARETNRTEPASASNPDRDPDRDPDWDADAASSPPTALVRALLDARADADARPARCREYFSTLCLLLAATRSPDGDDAEVCALLTREVEALRAAAPATDEDADAHLRGRLELIRCLMGRLRRDSPTARDAGRTLVRTLLFRCLFPEAVPMLKPPEEVLRDAGARSAAEARSNPEPRTGVGSIGSEEVEVLDEHLTATCSTPSTREAAFAFLAHLAARDDDCMLETTDTLASLHFRGETDLNEWEQFPGGVSKQPGGYVGLKNAGATCYMNAVFQQLWMQPSLRDAVLSVDAVAETEEERRESVFHQFQMMFASLAASRVDHYAPRGFWRAFKDYDGEPINVREHQDGLEFFGRLQDQVDAEFKKAVAAASDADPRRVKGAMETAMGGKFVNQVISRSCPHRSEREEEFVHVSVEVRNKRDLVESLQSYVSGELLEADNQWSCEACGCKRDAVKRACFRGAELPNTLCVHLKRFEFDYETMQRLKIKSRFEFPMELDMTPFTVEALERDASRDDDGSAPDENPLEPTLYRLVGVVVHSGTAFAGHYYSYIRERARPPGAPAEGGDPDLGSRWHVYDDTRVEPYDVASLEADTFGGKYTVNLSALQGASGDAASPKEFDRPNSAYMLFYERAASGAEDDSGGVGIASAPPSRVNTPALVARPVPTPPSAETVAPPAMPRRVRGAVMTQNLQFVFDANLFNREYFDFTRRLVESTATTTAANPSRKAQRREETRGPGAMRGVENGDDGHPHRDPEEAEERAVLGIRVATEFLCRVYLRAHRGMRDAESLASWRIAVVSLLGRHASARRWFLEFLRDRPAHLAAFLTRCPSAEARETFACLVAAALKFAVSLDEGGASADAVLAAARAEMGIEHDTAAAAAAASSSCRQPGRAARLVDRVLQNLVQALHDAATRPVRIASPAYCFHVLAEYASLGAAQRFQLLRYDVMDRLVEFTCAAYHAPARGANASSPETRGAYRLLSALVRSCDVSEPRRFFAAACAQRAAAHAGGAVVWRVGDLQEDAAADGSTAPTAPPSPFALDGGVFAVPTSARAKLHEPMFAEMLVDLATESEAVMSALLHLCWRWETMSRLAVAAVLDAVEQQSSTDLPGTLRVARRLLELDDWCARIRAGYLLEGKMFQHPHALAQGQLPPHVLVATAGEKTRRMGVIEQAAYDTFPYHKRFLVLRWLLEMTRANASLLENVAAQAEDFSYVVHAYEDEYSKQGPPPRTHAEWTPEASSRGETEIGDSTSAPSGGSESRDVNLDDPGWVRDAGAELLRRVTEQGA